LHRDRPALPGLRDRGAQFRIRRAGQCRPRLAVGFLQVFDADRHLAVHGVADEVRVRITDRRIGMLGDSAAHRRGDTVPVKAHRGVAVAVRQESLDDGVRQPTTAQRYTVPTRRVGGQPYQDILRGCRVSPQPGQSWMIEARHAPNVVGPARTPPGRGWTS
jgi:hypothetical protein